MARRTPTSARDAQNPVEMIRHYNVIVQFNFRSQNGRPKPFIFYNPPVCIQLHTVINNFTKETFMAMSAYGDEIHPCLRVVIRLQAYGPAMVSMRIVSH